MNSLKWPNANSDVTSYVISEGKSMPRGRLPTHYLPLWTKKQLWQNINILNQTFPIDRDHWNFTCKKMFVRHCTLRIFVFSPSYENTHNSKTAHIGSISISIRNKVPQSALADWMPETILKLFTGHDKVVLSTKLRNNFILR